MGILEGMLLAGLLYTGGFFHGYISKEDKIAKTINIQIPKKMMEKYNLRDCYEAKGESCDKLISQPRYIVSEKDYYDFNINYKERTLYLNVCQDGIDTYNNSKYVED